jgi:RTX calcium-binding nonapeptide repeat (4 copies)
MNIKRILIGAGGGVATVGLAAFTAACAPLTVQATVANGTLTVTGTDRSDAIAMRLKAGAPNTLQVDVGDDGGADFEFDRTTFGQIHVLANAGEDRIRIDQVNGAFADEATTLDGGAGNDVIVGGDGNESLLGGAGNDSIDGNKGADQADLGSEDDSFVWDPGDGSDVIEGRAGSDALVFNGANVDESFSLSAEGQRAILTRNVGNIRMDMDGVETLNLTMLDGFDNFNVGDFMFNTALNKANVDMSGPAGGPDAQTDSVNLVGTPDVDHITATATGTRIDVAGVPVATSITGSKIPDQLQIAAEGPDDTITVDPAVDALVTTLINVHV